MSTHRLEHLDSMLAGHRSAQRWLEQYQNLHGAQVLKTLEAFRAISESESFRRLNLALAEISERYAQLQPRLSETHQLMMAAFQRVERDVGRLGAGFNLPRNLVAEVLREKVPEASEEDARFIADQLEVHLPAVVDLLVADEGEREVEVRAVTALAELDAAVTSRLGATRREWFRDIIQIIVMLLIFSADRRVAIEQADRQIRVARELAEQASAESREEKRLLQEQIEVAREGVELQRRELEAEALTAEELGGLNERMARLEKLFSENNGRRFPE